MIINFRIEQEFGFDSPVETFDAMRILRGVTQSLDRLLGTEKDWFEKGYSRKQALQHRLFFEDNSSAKILERWGKRYKKNHPFFGEGIWDGGPDNDSASVNLYTSFSNTNLRDYPGTLMLEFSVNPSMTKLNVEGMIIFFKYLLKMNGNCTFLCAESGGYSFSNIIIKNEGYIEEFKKVFPDRISCGWMLYIPHIILPELIPEAARVVPVMGGEKQKGTIIISTEGIFDGDNPAHIAKANDIEIKLLDLGFLPLMTEL